LEIPPKNPSARLPGDWSEGDTFVWLVSDEILLEYKRVLARLGVRRPLTGKIVNLLREDAELVPASALSEISPDPRDAPFCACAETGRAEFIFDLLRALIGVANVASNSDWQQSAKRLVDILIAGSRPSHVRR
jgi:predicted nucleic acid-binding protein